jgi:hypothetical protein
MITNLNIKIKYLTQDNCNKFIENIDFHKLSCSCGMSGQLIKHAYYDRHIKMPEGVITLTILRVKCTCCGKTHAIFPESIVPYSRAPYTPQSKAKIERWFRTLKDQWMSQLNMNDFNNLGELRTSLISYVHSYNQHIHSSLNGLSPQDRFFSESHMIKRLSEEQIETSFLLEYERRVSTDNVVMIDETAYEVDYKYSRQKITLRYAPDLSKIYIVDKNTDELTEIKLLNKHDNSAIKRKKIKLTGE